MPPGPIIPGVQQPDQPPVQESVTQLTASTGPKRFAGLNAVPAWASLFLLAVVLLAAWELRPDEVVKEAFVGVLAAFLTAIKTGSTQQTPQ